MYYTDLFTTTACYIRTSITKGAGKNPSNWVNT